MAKERITEIDLLRTLAMVMMIVFHTAFDLQIFYDWHIDIWGEGWQLLRILTASLFLFVSGIATNFSTKPLKRSLVVIACALLISIVTYLYDPTTFIYFGILHCIGVGMLFLIPLKKFKEMNIVLGCILLLFPLSTLHFPFTDRPTLDYYPLLPWFGLMLIGSGLGHYLYIRNDLRYMTMRAGMPALRYAVFLGKYALLIYMIHQPIILGILYVVL